jgi:proton glutamate symport protein
VLSSSLAPAAAFLHPGVSRLYMQGSQPLPRRRTTWLLTLGSLVCLAAGISLGIWIHTHPGTAIAWLVKIASPVGRAWVNALRMTVIPLVVTQLTVAVVSARGRAVGRMGGLALASFVGLLVTAAAFTIVAAPLLISLLAPPPGTLGALKPASTQPTGPLAATSPGDWLVAFVPTNPLKSAVQDDLLPLLFFTILFALALSRSRAEGRVVVTAACQAIAEAMLTLVGWIMRVAPIGVFALGLSLATEIGMKAAGALVGFVAVLAILLVAFNLALYPIAAIVGGVPLRRFAAAALPSQIVGVSTRSSLASLPALLQGAERQLVMSPVVSGFVLPLAVSTFKVNRTISAPAKVMFMAYLYGIPLSLPQLATFALSALILSFSTAGIPSSGSTQTLPLYLAAGVPLEGILLFEAVDSVTDVLKTVLNVTGDMTAASIVARFSPAAAAADAERAPAGEQVAALS